MFEKLSFDTELYRSITNFLVGIWSVRHCEPVIYSILYNQKHRFSQVTPEGDVYFCYQKTFDRFDYCICYNDETNNRRREKEATKKQRGISLKAVQR